MKTLCTLEGCERLDGMGSTFYSLRYHLVFATKERRPWIARNWREDLHAYLGGTMRGLGGVAEAIGGVADHVHLLCGLASRWSRRLDHRLHSVIPPG